MRILDIAINDLRQLSRDRTSFVFLLVMPLTFTLLFGFAFGGFSVGEGDEPEDPRLAIIVLDLDGSALSGELPALLEGSTVVRPANSAATETELEERLANGDFAAGLIIPAGFGAAAYAGEPQPLMVVASVMEAAGGAASREIEALSVRLEGAMRTAHAGVAAVEARQPFANEAARQAYFDAAARRTLAGWSDLPVTMRVTQSAAGEPDVVAEVYGGNAFAHSSPGMMAQFAIAGLMGAAGILVAERKSRSLRRLLTAAISPAAILAGHYLAMFIVIFVQLIILAVVGQLFLRLNYFGQPAATLLMVTATAMFSAALGLLIGTVARSEEQTIALALIPMFVLAALGGAWVPLEFTPPAFQQIARLTPLAWLMDGMKDIIIRGQGVEAVWPAAAVLLGYAGVLLILAVWRFRFE